MMQNELKHYTAREERCSAAIHLAGIGLVLGGAWPMTALALRHDDPGLRFGLGFFWITLLLMFSVSSAYHLLRGEREKIFFRKLDHVAIYWLITGTYAPILLGVLKTPSAYWLGAFLLAVSLLGSAGKFLFAHRFHKLETVLYLLMGWGCVLIAVPMIRAMSRLSLGLLLAGGIAYSVGVVFYVGRREFSHAVWHVFVLAGAVLQGCAILTMLD